MYNVIRIPLNAERFLLNPRHLNELNQFIYSIWHVIFKKLLLDATATLTLRLLFEKKLGKKS